MTTPNRYFPHIDGLRAIAVIAVILFHYNISGFSGGYIGVDVFFVISGFLITGIIQRKYTDNNFSLLNFYKKRLYRIYPALLFTCTLTFIIASILFSPTHLENLGKNLLGALSFSSNFIYWRSIGYFQILDSYDPFVPTWSLSIELQYYFLFPIFYILVLRFFKNYAVAIISLCMLASLALAEVFLPFTNNFVYYNLPFRFFEFAIGTLCFYWLQQNHEVNQYSKYFPIMGLFLLVASISILDESHPFPGLWALMPCVGAALIIVSAKGSLGFGIFANPIAIYIGKISYSFYLIHWPVYVLFSYWFYDEIDYIAKFCLFLFSGFLAVVTYHCIENSYRSQDISIIRKLTLFLFTALIFIGGYSVYTQDGWAWRLSENQRKLLQNIDLEYDALKGDFDRKFPSSQDLEFNSEKHSGLECSYNNAKSYEILIPCLEHNLTKSGGSGVLIIGDSNGADTYRAFELAYPETDFAILQQAGCAASEYLKEDRSGKWCFKDLQSVLSILYEKKIVKSIILSSRWVMQPYSNLPRDIETYKVPVMLFGPTPMLRHDTFETFFMTGKRNFDDIGSLSLTGVAFHKDILKIESYLEALPSSLYISKASLLCPDGLCPVFIGDGTVPLFLDDQHLSSVGIRYLAEKLKENKDVRDFITIQ